MSAPDLMEEITKTIEDAYAETSGAVGPQCIAAARIMKLPELRAAMDALNTLRAVRREARRPRGRPLKTRSDR